MQYFNACSLVYNPSSIFLFFEKKGFAYYKVYTFALFCLVFSYLDDKPNKKKKSILFQYKLMHANVTASRFSLRFFIFSTFEYIMINYFDSCRKKKHDLYPYIRIPP